MSKITIPPLPETYAWHYYNNGGGTVLHRGPSRRLDADMQAAKEYPRVHHVVPLYTAEQLQADRLMVAEHVIRACAEVAAREMVAADETGMAEDYAYNNACHHIEAAIVALLPAEELQP